MRHAAVIALVLSCSLAVIGCGRRTPTAEPINAGLNALERGDAPDLLEPASTEPAVASQIAESARMLDDYFATINRTEPEDAAPAIVPNSDPAPASTAAPAATTDDSGFGLAGVTSELPATEPDDTDTDLAVADDTTGDAADDAEPIIEPPTETPEQRRETLVAELVDLIALAGVESDDPANAGLVLASLEILRPGALEGLAGTGVFSPGEIEALQAIKDMLAETASGDGSLDPGRLADTLADLVRRLERHAPLRIVTAELCTRVEGFGRYTSFGRNTFIAGRAQPVILYVEVDRFGQESSTDSNGADRFGVELSQRVELWHAGDDLLAFAMPAATDRSRSRNWVRDYYLINQFTLPSNLGVGRYHLKITMRDLLKDSVAETIVAIEIVADPTLVRHSGQ